MENTPLWLDWIVSCEKKIPKNTDGVVSGLILASVLLKNIQFKIECNLFPRLETTREKPWVWDWVVSCKTDIWE